MNVLLIKPNEEPQIVTINGTLKSMQELVGGYIEVVSPFPDPLALVCNEEGKIRDMPLNRVLKNSYGEVTDVICGDFFLVGTLQDDFVSLGRDLSQKYKEVFGCKTHKKTEEKDNTSR